MGVLEPAKSRSSNGPAASGPRDESTEEADKAACQKGRKASKSQLPVKGPASGSYMRALNALISSKKADSPALSRSVTVANLPDLLHSQTRAQQQRTRTTESGGQGRSTRRSKIPTPHGSSRQATVGRRSTATSHRADSASKSATSDSHSRSRFSTSATDPSCRAVMSPSRPAPASAQSPTCNGLVIQPHRNQAISPPVRHSWSYGPGRTLPASEHTTHPRITGRTPLQFLQTVDTGAAAAAADPVLEPPCMPINRFAFCTSPLPGTEIGECYLHSERKTTNAATESAAQNVSNLCRVTSSCRYTRQLRNTETRPSVFNLALNDCADCLTALQVYEAKPKAYWCGRFASLTDRLRSSYLETAMTARSHRDLNTLDGNETARTKKVFSELMAICVTSSARESLRVSKAAGRISVRDVAIDVHSHSSFRTNMPSRATCLPLARNRGS